MTGKAASNIFTIIQCIATVLFSFLIGHALLIVYNTSLFTFFEFLQKMLPVFFMVWATLIPTIILKIKHHALASESEVLPILFMFIALESIICIPLLLPYAGSLSSWISPNQLVFLNRFIVISTSLLFVFASLSYMGINFNKLGIYITLSLICCALIAFLTPKNPLLGSDPNATADLYNASLVMLVITLDITALLSFVVAAVKDRINHTMRRTITFFLIILGNMLIVIDFKSLIASILGVIFYIAGDILLLSNSSDSF